MLKVFNLQLSNSAGTGIHFLKTKEGVLKMFADFDTRLHVQVDILPEHPLSERKYAILMVLNIF